MAVFFNNGSLLFRNGSLAMSSNCCCDGPPPCGDCTSFFVVPTPLWVNFGACDACASFQSPHVLTWKLESDKWEARIACEPPPNHIGFTDIYLSCDNNVVTSRIVLLDITLAILFEDTKTASLACDPGDCLTFVHDSPPASDCECLQDWSLVRYGKPWGDLIRGGKCCPEP